MGYEWAYLKRAPTCQVPQFSVRCMVGFNGARYAWCNRKCRSCAKIFLVVALCGEKQGPLGCEADPQKAVTFFVAQGPVLRPPRSAQLRLWAVLYREKKSGMVPALAYLQSGRQLR